MRKVILDFPWQFEKALEFSKNIKVEGKFDNIIVVGMGGSALPGDLLATYITDPKLPIYVSRDYVLPKYTTDSSLVIASSYSGTTEETLAAYKEALKRKITIFGITSGATLEKFCKENDTPVVIMPKGIQPRSANGYAFTSMVKVLSNSGIIPDKSKEILDMAQNLKKLDLEKQGKSLAKNLLGKIPVIYTSNKLKVLAKIWKLRFCENSKIPAFFNYFPELNHSEMIGYSKIPNSKFQIPNLFHMIILRDKEDHPRILKRMGITADLIRSKGIEVTIIDIIGKDLLTKIFSCLMLADWTSYYLALGYGIDPALMDMVEDFKKKMRG